MTTPEILSLVWIVAAGAIVIGFAFLTIWLSERAESRKAR